MALYVYVRMWYQYGDVLEFIETPTAIVYKVYNNKFQASTIDFVQHVHDDILEYS